MNDTSTQENQPLPSSSFFDRPGVHVDIIPVGPGVPMGFERVTNAEIGIGGAYGAWGAAYDNASLPAFLEGHMGLQIAEAERLSLAELGFVSRHHIPRLSPAEDVELETEVGARFLREACRANGWQPAEVEAVFLGMTLPASGDYTERIAERAGIPAGALKVTLHKACDGGVAGLNLALNPGLAAGEQVRPNLAAGLLGKKVLVGGIEGLSRVMKHSSDKQALQLFGSAAAVFGVIPGQTMKFLAGVAQEVYDEDGLLQVRMTYPHSRQRVAGQSLVEVAQTGPASFRVAGLMHEPAEGAGAVVMAGPMGMVKLFVRSGVVAVRGVYQAYRDLMTQQGTSARELKVVAVHHANYKINLLKAKQLLKEGFSVPIPWLLSEFGNVSAASAMIAFLRALPALAPGDHVLVDGFGAGTYYDVVAVEMGVCPAPM